MFAAEAMLEYANLEYRYPLTRQLADRKSWQRVTSSRPTWSKVPSVHWAQHVKLKVPPGVIGGLPLLQARRAAIRSWMVSRMRDPSAELPLWLRYLPPPELVAHMPQPDDDVSDVLAIVEASDRAASPLPAPTPMSMPMQPSPSPTEQQQATTATRPQELHEWQLPPLRAVEVAAPPPMPLPAAPSSGAPRGVSYAQWAAVEPPPRGKHANLYRGVRAPIRQTAHPALGLSSYEMQPGVVAGELVDRVRTFLSGAETDDLIVRRNGLQGPFLRKKDTWHPSPDRRSVARVDTPCPDVPLTTARPPGVARRHSLTTSARRARRHMGVFLGDDRYVSYPQRGICSDPYQWTMGDFDPCVFELGVVLWNIFHDVLPPEAQAHPPNSCVAQRYLGRRRDKVAPHTDSLPSRNGLEVEQGKNTPVIGFSLGADMMFWVNKILNSPTQLGRARAAAVLRDGGAWCWMRRRRVNSAPRRPSALSHAASTTHAAAALAAFDPTGPATTTCTSTRSTGPGSTRASSPRRMSDGRCSSAGWAAGASTAR